ncbi:hypothetical protein ACQR13_25375 [Bradyrhizobium sp. HKCCYLRH3059]|uniref:hypothetical protein n=1 Tax=Bradyrhizobium sp. HKCCYLRH3059 TaxID=3420745 RepID=UPI003EBFDCD0
MAAQPLIGFGSENEIIAFESSVPAAGAGVWRYVRDHRRSHFEDDKRVCWQPQGACELLGISLRTLDRKLGELEAGS